MKIYFSKVNFFTRQRIKKVCETALRMLNQPTEQLEMNVSVVSSEEICRLNKERIQVYAETDVLSFPTIEAQRKVIDIDDHKEDINPESGKLNLGDVVICKKVARKQAKEMNHSLKNEICFLTLHSLLHLLGYDHMEPDDEHEMFDLQRKILDEAKIKHGYIV